MSVVCTAAWLVLLIGLACAAWSEARDGNRRNALWMLGLVLLAFAARALFKTSGPGDLKFDQWGAAVGPDVDPRSNGLAPIALYYWLFRVLPQRFDVFIWGSVVLGALSVVLAGAAARLLGVGKVGALIGAAVLALHPMALRVSGVANRQAMVVFLFLATLWALLRLSESLRLTNIAVAVAATLLLLETRLESVLLVGLLAGLPVLLHRRFGRAALPVAVALAGAAVVSWLLIEQGVDDHIEWGIRIEQILRGRSLLNPYAHVWLSPLFTPWAMTILAAAGLVGGLWKRQGHVFWCAGALLAMGFVYSVAPAGDFMLADARYQTASVVPLAMLCGAGFDLLWTYVSARARRLGPALIVVTAVALVATTVPLAKAVLTPRTLEQEFSVLLEATQRLPDNALILYVEQPMACTSEMGLRAPAWLPKVEGRPGQVWQRVRPPDSEQFGTKTLGCPNCFTQPTFYAHMASCSLPRDEDYSASPAIGVDDSCPPERVVRARFFRVCDRMLTMVFGKPVIAEQLPARRYNLDDYAADPVPVGIYRVDVWRYGQYVKTVAPAQ